jgi:uncharacterized protein YlxP (DUF503 family)
MSQKKLTPIIAKALAEKVRAELVARHKGSSEILVTKVQSSKLYKELLLTIAKVNELEEKRQLIRKEIEDKFSTKISDVGVSAYHSEPHVSVNYHSSFSVDSIKDMILIEDYMSDDTKTAEEFITYIADKILNH